MKPTKTKGLPLVINHWLFFDWCEVYEAAFILTDWLENMIAIGVPDIIRDQFGRGVIYAPSERLLKKTLNEKTSEVLLQMRRSIENGELNAHLVNLSLGKSYGKNVSYLVRSHDLISLFLLKGFILPHQLQQALSIYQLKDIQLYEDLQKRVKNLTVAQYILNKNPKLIKNDLINENKPWLDWFKRFGTAAESQDKEYKAVLRDLENEIFPKSKKLGRKPKNEICLQKFRAISEVKGDLEGISHYCIPLLKTVAVTITKIKFWLIGQGQEQLLKLTEQEFVNEILKDKIMELYSKGASSNVLKLIGNFCRRELSSYYSHYKLNFLSDEDRKKMSIDQLLKLNKELCFERLTTVERKAFE